MRSFGFVSVFILAVVFIFGDVAEAAKKQRCRSVSRCSMQYQIVSPGVSTEVKSSHVEKSRMVCDGNTCRLVTTTSHREKVEASSVSSWDAEAQRQAELMADRNTYGHVASAAQTSTNAVGHVVPVFVGVGVDGITCQGSGVLVADAVAFRNGHSYHCRIWLR